MMKHFKILLFLVFVFTMQSQAQTQEQNFSEENNVQESLKILLNRSTALVGETVHYQLYSLNPKNGKYSELSKIAYLEIVNSDHQRVLQQKINLERGIGNGQFFIPSSFQNGHYKLIAYTKLMLNQRLQFLQKDLVILNPYQSIPKNVLKKETKLEVSNQKVKITSASAKISVETDKQHYQNREKVSLTISGNKLDPENVYALSVIKKDSLNFLAHQFSTEKGSYPKISLTGASFLPELRGEVIQGKIKSERKSNPSLKNKLLALSIPEENIVKVIQTDRDGKFIFDLPNRNGLEKSTLKIQFLKSEEASDSLTITLDSLQVNHKALQVASKMSVPIRFENQITERSIGTQIDNAYYQTKRDSIVQQQARKPFYDSTTKEYILDEYTRFNTVEKTIIEVVPELNVIKTHGHHEISAREFEQSNLHGIYGKTLVLVDGSLVKDIDKFLEYNPKLIEKIDVVNRGYVYGPYVFNGVVNFITKNQDYQDGRDQQLVTTEIMTPLPKVRTYQPTYPNQQLEKTPDYRYELFWKPEVQFNRDNQTFSFYTSDISGTFEVRLMGYTAEGDLIKVTKRFEVK